MFRRTLMEHLTCILHCERTEAWHLLRQMSGPPHEIFTSLSAIPFCAKTHRAFGIHRVEICPSIQTIAVIIDRALASVIIHFVIIIRNGVTETYETNYNYRRKRKRRYQWYEKSSQLAWINLADAMTSLNTCTTPKVLDIKGLSNYDNITSWWRRGNATVYFEEQLRQGFEFPKKNSFIYLKD